MGQRLPELSQSWAELAARGYDKTADAARIRASGKAALGQGIANGLASITTAMLRKKENARADSIRAEANARQDARYAVSDARDAAHDARDVERDQRSRDEFMLRYTEGKKGELTERIRAGDVTAQEEFAQNERVAQTLTARLMAHQSNVMPSANSQAPSMPGVEHLPDGSVRVNPVDDSSVPPPRPTTKAPGCRKGEACDVGVGGGDKNSIAVPATSPVDTKRAALGSAMDAALAEREKRLRDHARASTEVDTITDLLKEAQKAVENRNTTFGIAKAQAEVKDLTRRLGPAREIAKVAAANAVSASHEADQVAEVQRDLDAKKRTAAEVAKKQADELLNWSGFDSFDGVDFTNEDVQHKINQLHGSYKEEHDFEMKKREATMRAAEKPTTAPLDEKTRDAMRGVIERATDLGIPDASGLDGKTLVNLYNRAVSGGRADKKAEATNADRDAKQAFVETKYANSLSERIAELEGELADMPEDAADAKKKWAKLGALKAEKSELEKGGDPKAKARAEYDALPEAQKTPENAAKLLKKHGG